MQKIVCMLVWSPKQNQVRSFINKKKIIIHHKVPTAKRNKRKDKQNLVKLVKVYVIVKCVEVQPKQSTLSGIKIKLKKLLTEPSWDERARIRGSEYILFEILD